jgi:hypothetical protein
MIYRSKLLPAYRGHSGSSALSRKVPSMRERGRWVCGLLDSMTLTMQAGSTQTTKQQDAQTQTVRSHCCPAKAGLHYFVSILLLGRHISWNTDLLEVAFCHDLPFFRLYFGLIHETQTEKQAPSSSYTHTVPAQCNETRQYMLKYVGGSVGTELHARGTAFPVSSTVPAIYRLVPRLFGSSKPAMANWRPAAWFTLAPAKSQVYFKKS